MNFKDEILSVKKKYKSELQHILDFTNTTERELTARFDKMPDAKPQGKDLDEVKKFVGVLGDFINGESNGETIKFNSSFLCNLVKEKTIPLKHKDFLMDMTLSYLISYQEAMFKDFLLVVLVNQKHSLKSKNTITYKDILAYESLDELVKALAQKEVDKLGHGSVDDISTYIKDKFNVSMDSFDKWEFIVESTYRRNLVIHNKGVTNEVYCKRIKGTETGKKLTLDIEYVVNVANNLIELSEYCSNAFIEKFKLK